MLKRLWMKALIRVSSPGLLLPKGRDYWLRNVRTLDWLKYDTMVHFSDSRLESLAPSPSRIAEYQICGFTVNNPGKSMQTYAVPQYMTNIPD